METYNLEWVEAQIAQTIQLWHENAAGWSRNPPRYNLQEQEEHERAYDEALQAVERDLQQECETNTEKAFLKDRIISSFGKFSAKALHLDRNAIDLLTYQFVPVGTGLAQWARAFDPALSMASIIQAARNAWTACGLQPLLGLDVSLTPGILGYSLLYPYSDNYLDDQDVTNEAKLSFSRRFRARLLGQNLPATDDRELAIGKLIALIEMQYPRDRYPHVFDCLLAIHEAQERSIAQISNKNHGCDADYLRLSCRKGGTSVLTDACLGRGNLTSQESRFAFEWGVLLQLGDDLQDVRDDLRRGSMTLFSRRAADGVLLDGLTVQLLNFSEMVGRRMEELPNGTRSLKDLLKMSWQSLIIRAVADSHEFFSSRFLTEAERCSPFRFDFLRLRSGRLASREGLYAKLFDVLLDPAVDRDERLPHWSASTANERFDAGLRETSERQIPC